MAETTSKRHFQAVTYDYKRTYDSVSDAPFHTHTETPVSGVDYTYTNISSGVKRPHWRADIRAGASATTEFSYQYLDCRNSITRVEYNHKIVNNTGDTQTVRETLQGILPSSGAIATVPPPPGLIDDITNRCIRKFVDRCDQARSSFEAGQDLGEIKQTLEGIIHPMNSLRKHVLSYFSGLKKLRKYRKDRKTLVKALNDSYLEWTFGWNPLASDIADGIAGLEAQGSRFDVVPVRASASASYGGSIVSSNPAAGSYYVLRARSMIVNYYSLRYMGGIRTGAVNGRISSAQMLQLDLPHFVPTVWDLLPWSFVVDYFANVGDIIKANSFRFADLSWACYTVRQECREVFTPTSIFKIDLTPFGKVLQQSAVYSGGGREVHLVQGGRGILSNSQLMPRFTFSVPLSKKPWENMGSLVLSQMQRTSQLLR